MVIGTGGAMDMSGAKEDGTGEEWGAAGTKVTGCKPAGDGNGTGATGDNPH